ncbi:MAG TPA: S8 family peptidase [Fimbriimonadaceae bacterium]|nr:S8 family peptidase [Fimbriimonadaceae bacterium]
MLPLGLAVIVLNRELPSVSFPPHPRRLIIKSESRPKATKDYRVVWHLPEIGYAAIEFNKAPKNLAAERARLETMFDSVEYDRGARLAYNPNDANWPQMWHFQTIKANLAWDLSFGSPIKVAVIDTGLDYNHPDLAGNVWTNPGEIAGNGLDDDGNGYADDIHGYDFAYMDSEPDDVYGHGTPCAGLVGAVQDNTIGVTGIAPNARIMGLKACIDSGYLYDSFLIPAYIYAANMGARVFSMSYFSDRVSSGEKTAMDYAVAHGVLPIAAAGNSNSGIPYYPSGYDNVVAVGALDGGSNRAGFSNFGTWVDVAAPGVSLWAPTVGGGYTSGFGGTSGATPHVAGLATLLLGARPSATADEIRAAIEDTASPVNVSTYGKLDCQLAMQAILGSPATLPAAQFQYMTPAAYDMTADRAFEQIVTIKGRSLGMPNTVEVLADGESLPIVGRTRQTLSVEVGARRPNAFTLKVNGAVVATWGSPSGTETTYAATEVSSQGTSYSGSSSAMIKSDASYAMSGTRGDGTIRFESVFRLVKPASTMKLRLGRSYTQSGGTERVYLYDWTSASYPYGNFVEVGSAPTSTAATSVEYTIPNASRFIDVEGSVYVVVYADGMPGGTELRVDVLNYSRP